MRRRSLRLLPYLALLALAAGLLVFESVSLLDESFRNSENAVGAAKRAVLGTADLDRLHHEVFEDVGPLRWERDVRPGILGELTRRTAVSLGTPFPGGDEVVDWVRSHPSEAREILTRYRR